MIYHKYIIEPELLPQDATDSEETINPIDGNYVLLGNECTKEATFDGDEILTEAEYSDNLLIDVVWNSEEPKEWTPYRVTPKTHKHWYGGESGRILYERSNPE